jgi:hypothetical protein
MARPINAALTVSAFTPTGNAGEYTFESAQFSNQADATGNGAYDVTPGFVLYIPASDVNTFMQIPGIFHRYVLTAATPIDQSTLSGTILWDEPGDEVDAVTNSTACLLAQVTPNLKLGMLPSDAVYTELVTGNTAEAFAVDERNILDAVAGTITPATGTKTQELIAISETGLSNKQLLHTPLDPPSVVIWINGIRYTYGGDFLIAGATIGWQNNYFNPDSFDNVIVEYTY